MRWFDRLASLVVDRSWLVVAVLLALTLVIGAGAVQVEETTEMEMFDEEPTAVEKRGDVQANFSVHEGNTTQSVVVVRNESGNVLSRESLLASLRYQRSLTENETLNSTLTESRAMFGIENLVATALYRFESSQSGAEMPPLSAQIEQLESASDEQVRQAVSLLLDPGTNSRATEVALDLLPQDYDPGSTEAGGRLTILTQETDGLVTSPPELSEETRDAQAAAAELTERTSRDEYRVSGKGLVVVEEEQSMQDSFQLVGPIALVFVLVTLAVAYRDLLDLVLGVAGILVVLVWTFGAMGWLGIDFSIMMIATPVLLIGLSIDYCIHVVMRYRENRAGNGTASDVESTPQSGVRPAMRSGLAGLGPALALVTVTGAIGFLSVRTSGVPVLSEFGVATAVGIVAALVVFGALVPALKVKLDAALTDRGYDRANRALGTAGRMRGLLAGVAHASARRPAAIVLAALVVSSLGVVAATQVDTEFSTDDYVAEEAPEWTNDLPGPMATGEYEIRETQQYLYANFQSPDQRVHVLAEGDVADPETLHRVAAAERDAATRSVTFTGPTGESAVDGPVETMQVVAATNETFADTFESADTDGDGIPEENVSAVLDGFAAAAPDRADQLLHRADGEYEALRVEVVVDGTRSLTTVADEMSEVGDVAADDDAGGDVVAGDDAAVNTTVTVTGTAITNELVQRTLATTIVEGLAVALVAVTAVLMLAFRRLRASATLGAVTVLPVLFGLSWILGAMYLVNIPFSFATAIIGSIAIGLGVDYAIHMSERYSHELSRHGDIETALEEAVVGTGGALLGSAVTTAGGFGVLAFALLPVLQQFGLIIALTLVFAFVASVLVLPGLLVLWTRYLHEPTPDDTRETVPASESQAPQ